jgi:hypothetical protein
MVLSGLSINVPIPLSYQPLVILGRVYLIDHSRIIDRNRDYVSLMPVQDGARPFARGRGTFEEVIEQRRPQMIVGAAFPGWAPRSSLRTSMTSRIRSTVATRTWEVDRPNEARRRLYGVERGWPSERGTGPVSARILNDDAVVAG